MPDYKTNMSRVSKSVQDQISLIKQMGGNKNKIDSQAEFAKLQDLLSKSSEKMGKDERMYVEGLMIDYQNTVKDAEVTQGAKKDLADIKKMMPGKKELNEMEAHQLLALIQNTRGDYSEADIEYFKQALIDAGFKDLLSNTEEGTTVEPTGKNGITPAEDKENSAAVKDELNSPDTISEPDMPSAQPKSDLPSKPDMPSVEPKPDIPPENTKPVKPKLPVDELPLAQEPKEPEIDEIPNDDVNQKLTAEQKKEAIDTGKHAAKMLDGYTMDSEQALILEYTRDKVNSKNIIEFMSGVKEGGISGFFKQVITEYDFDQKYEIAKNMALKLRDYVETHEGKDSKNYKIIDGIIAEGSFGKDSANSLDMVTKGILAGSGQPLRCLPRDVVSSVAEAMSRSVRS